jgi:hypothetical protein
MQPSGKKSLKRLDRPLHDDMGPRIIESERESPTRGMNRQQRREALQKLLNG